jgi:hypothetical protein
VGRRAATSVSLWFGGLSLIERRASRAATSASPWFGGLGQRFDAAPALATVNACVCDGCPSTVSATL